MAEFDESGGPSLDSPHVPVMLREVIAYLAPQPGQVIVDGTLGAGGHSREIARHIGPGGLLVGIDRDPSMIEIARDRVVGCRVVFAEANFADLRRVLNELSVDRVDGVLLDLGVSSVQLDTAERGFSFSRSGPLDMRMNPREGEPAARLVNRLRAENLADIIFQYGEERYSRRIAAAIVEARRRRPLETTAELADVVRRAVPRGRHERIDPATRTFQALRIAVNGELESLKGGLTTLAACLKPQGRAVVISFHSLEDRIVKQVFRERDRWERLCKKPVIADEQEVRTNPRARSAKLRAARTRNQLNCRLVQPFNRSTDQEFNRKETTRVT
jgi:16S rRNA (cytosine1402-N4)-methyltransferase